MSVVGNSLASPVLCRPVEHGADIVVHSTNKYLAGHSDALGGVAAFADSALRYRIWPRTVELGARADPFAARLTPRGLPSLPLPMRRHCANAEALANRLTDHPAVTTVRRPWLAAHPTHDLAWKLLGGGGGLDMCSTNWSRAPLRFSVLPTDDNAASARARDREPGKIHKTPTILLPGIASWREGRDPQWP